MTDRFASVNLADLEAPVAVEALDVEVIKAARMGGFVACAAALGLVYDVDAIETDPIVIAEEADAYRELLLRQRIDDAVKAVLLPTAVGTDLDAIGAQYDTARRITAPATATTVVVYEDDDTFRELIQEAWEALSIAGPPGAYEYLAKEASGLVVDARCYGAEHSAFVSPGQVVVTVLSSEAGGIASQSKLQTVSDAFGGYAIRLANPQPAAADIVVFDRAKARSQSARPLNDQVFVEVAQVVTYEIAVTLILPPGPDPSIILSKAIGRAQALAANRYRIEGGATLAAIEAALGVPDANGVSQVIDVLLTSPAASMGPMPRVAPLCIGIAITTQIAG